MRLIETEEAAARLARVILSDIELYNKDKIGTGADLLSRAAEHSARHAVSSAAGIDASCFQ